MILEILLLNHSLGWGTSGGENILQEAEVNVLTEVECAEHWGGTAFDDEVVCSRDKNDIGDAGMCVPVRVCIGCI